MGRVAGSNPDYDLLLAEGCAYTQVAALCMRHWQHVWQYGRKGHDDLTSSHLPQFITGGLLWVWPNRWQQRIRGCAFVAGLNWPISQHELTTAMRHLSHGSRYILISENFRGCQGPGRFFALHRIKPHAPPRLCGPKSESFGFAAAKYALPGRSANALAREPPAGHNPPVDATFGVDYGVSSCLLPTLSAPERQSLTGAAFARYSSRSLRIFTVHRFYPTWAQSCQFQMVRVWAGISVRRQTACRALLRPVIRLTHPP